MESSSFLKRLSFAAITGTVCAMTVNLRADEWASVPSQPADGTIAASQPANNSQADAQPESAQPESAQKMFASPDDAVKALRIAVEADDQTALDQIFGPEYTSLKTGDKVQDANNLQHFASALSSNCHLERENDNEYFVDVGTNDWPMPVPLMQKNGQWYFDTAAGREEIIDRHVGKDELTAIGVCHDFVQAEKEYASMNGGAYAEKFKSSPGKKDGLYWPTSAGEQPSPFDELVTEAYAEGYGGHYGSGRHPFHGYYFRILTAQGKDAPGGKMDYVSSGKLTKGFALVAYPENWNQSGVMTFIVNQDGKVYQRDFGDKTDRMASRLKDYNPDKNWTLVTDQGILQAAAGQ
jgi:Protein of unknown function (DUF2950)